MQKKHGHFIVHQPNKIDTATGYKKVVLPYVGKIWLVNATLL